ncbi:hypothetical protein SLE2022_207300 [Rubroshorea leprosula]
MSESDGDNSGFQSPTESRSSEKEFKDQNTPNDLAKTHTSPIQSTPLEYPAHDQHEPTKVHTSPIQNPFPELSTHDQPEAYHHEEPSNLQNSTNLHNTESLRRVMGLHCGTRKKKTKQVKRCKKWLVGSKQLKPSISDSFMERRSRLSTKEVSEMDIRRSVKFGKKLGLCFVGNEELFVSKFCELEERDLGHQMP